MACGALHAGTPASFSGLITLPHSPFLSRPPAWWSFVRCALASLLDRQMHTGSFLSLRFGVKCYLLGKDFSKWPIHIALLPHPLSYYLFCFLESVFPCLKSSFLFIHSFVPCLLCLTQEWQFQKWGPFLFGPPPSPQSWTVKGTYLLNEHLNERINGENCMWCYCRCFIKRLQIADRKRGL